MTEDKYSGKGIELYSEEVQGVLGAIPPWIQRWGITVLSIIVLILLVGSYFFKYPDTISSTMTLTSAVPPAGIIAKTSGKLSELLVRDGQVIKEKEQLAIIENPASTSDMLLLKSNLELILNQPDSIIQFSYRELKLGSVQALYVSFIRALDNYKQFVELSYYPKKINAIKDQINKYNQYYEGVGRQNQITKQQYRVAQSQYWRDSLLNKKDILSEEEMDQARNSYLQSCLSLESSCTNLDNLQVQIVQMQETLLDTEQKYQETKHQLGTELNSIIIQLINEINTWEMSYLLSSPIEGQITFTRYWSENQYLTMGETVFTVIPKDTNTLVGKALLPISRSGKVKVGQKVNIYFANYPDEEFGMVKGIVKNISLVPVAENYIVEITFPQGLTTTYNKRLPFSQEMQAQADIVTDDICLLERILLPVKKIMNEHF